MENPTASPLSPAEKRTLESEHYQKETAYLRLKRKTAQNEFEPLFVYGASQAKSSSKHERQQVIIGKNKAVRKSGTFAASSPHLAQSPEMRTTPPDFSMPPRTTIKRGTADGGSGPAMSPPSSPFVSNEDLLAAMEAAGSGSSIKLSKSRFSADAESLVAAAAAATASEEGETPSRRTKSISAINKTKGGLAAFNAQVLPPRNKSFTLSFKLDPKLELKRTEKLLMEKEEDTRVAAEIGKTLLERNEELEADLRHVRSRLGEAKETMTALATDNDRLRTEVVMLAGRVSSATDHNADLLGREAHLHTQLTQQHAWLRNEYSPARAKTITAQKDEIDQLTLRIDELTMSEERTRRARDRAISQNESLQEQINELQVAYETRVDAEEHEALKQKSRAMRSKLGDLRSRIKELESNRSALTLSAPDTIIRSAFADIIGNPDLIAATPRPANLRVLHDARELLRRLESEVAAANDCSLVSTLVKYLEAESLAPSAPQLEALPATLNDSFESTGGEITEPKSALFMVETLKRVITNLEFNLDEAKMLNQRLEEDIDLLKTPQPGFLSMADELQTAISDQFGGGPTTKEVAEMRREHEHQIDVLTQEQLQNSLEIESLRHQLARSKDEAEMNATAVLALKSTFTALDEKSRDREKQHSEEVDVLHNRIKVMTSEIDEVSTKKNELLAEHIVAINGMSSKIKSLQSHCEELEKDLTNSRLADAEVAKLVIQIESLKSKISELENDKSELQKEIKALSEEIARLNKQHLLDQETIQSLNQQHEKDNESITGLNQQHTVDLESIQSLTQQHDKDAESIQTLTQQNTVQLESIQSLTQQREKDAESIQSLTQQHDKDTESIKTLDQQHVVDIESIQSLTVQREKDIESIKILDQQHVVDVESIQSLTVQHDKDIESIQVLNQQHSVDLEAIQSLTQQHDKDTESIQSLTQQHTVDLESIQSLTQQHEKDTESIQSLTQQHDKDTESIQSLTQQHTVDLESIQSLTQQHEKDTESIKILDQQHVVDVESIQSLTQQHTVDLEAIQSLTKQHEKDTESIQSLTQQHEKDTESIKSLDQQHVVDVESIQTLNQQHEKDTESINILDQQHLVDLESIQSLTQQHEKDIESIKTLDQQHVVDIESIQTLNQQHDKDTESIQSLNQQHDKDMESIQSLRDEVQRLTETNTSLQSTNQELDADLTKQREKTSTQRVKIEELVVELQNQRENSDALVTENLQLKEEIRELRMKLDAKTKKHQAVKELSMQLTDMIALVQKKKEEQEIVESLVRPSDMPKDYDIAEELPLLLFINQRLPATADIAHVFPIDTSKHIGMSIYDGVLLCKLINFAREGTIDERVMNMQPSKQIEVDQNFNLVANSARAIGCILSNATPQLLRSDPRTSISLIYELVRVYLVSRINIVASPNLLLLKRSDEDVKHFVAASSSQLLSRWVLYHLDITKTKSTQEEIILTPQNCIKLLGKLDKDVVIPFDQDDNVICSWIANEAPTLFNVFSWLSIDTINSKNHKLAFLFIANLFLSKGVCISVDQSREVVVTQAVQEATSVFVDVEGTREERAFCMWINSLNINPYVNNLQQDLQDGLVILQMFDKIKNGSVVWKQVNSHPSNTYMEMENCNYGIDIAKKMRFSLVGIDGVDIHGGNRKLTLALIWQACKYHLLSILQSLRKTDTLRSSGGAGGQAKEVTEADIIRWANQKVTTIGKSTGINNFKDASIGNGLFLIDLLESVSLGAVNYGIVNPGETDEEKKLNAQYIINVARKLDCCIFLVWEDIVEVRPKMILTLVAQLYIKDTMDTATTE
eukprot:gene2555-2929_t